jgi:hypothetical protein
MSDNVIKSTDVNSAKKEKTVAKKAVAKKVAPKEKVASEIAPNMKVVIFESGFSYVSGDIIFSREDSIKEVTEETAEFLLTLDNFRLPDQLELEEYLNSKED